MSNFESIVAMLELLPEDDLSMVHNLVRKMLNNKSKIEPFMPLSEDQIYSMLADARKQAENCECDDGDVFYNSMVAKYVAD